MTQIKNQKNGFALLITLLTVSVIIAVTLAILELSLKQLSLSVDSRDSEIAFQAANAGLECAQRSRRVSSTTIETGGAFTIRCFGTSQAVTNNLAGITMTTPLTNGSIYRYQADIQWGTGVGTRCSEIDMITLIATNGSVTASGLLAQIPTYSSNTKTCTTGGRCTIAAVAGYNTPCSQKGALGTLKREILLEF